MISKAHVPDPTALTVLQFHKEQAAKRKEMAANPTARVSKHHDPYFGEAPNEPANSDECLAVLLAASKGLTRSELPGAVVGSSTNWDHRNKITFGDSDEVAQMLELMREAGVNAEAMDSLRRLTSVPFPVSVSLSDLLPTRLNAVTQLTSTHPSANCINGAFAWHDPSQPICYTDPVDAVKMLASDFEPLTEGTLKFGDVIMWHVQRGIAGGAVYIGNGIVWHKWALGSSAPYGFAHMDALAIDYFETQWGVDVTFYRKKKAEQP